MKKFGIGIILLLSLALCVFFSIGYAEQGSGFVLDRGVPDPNGHEDCLMLYLPFNGTALDMGGGNPVGAYGNISFVDGGCGGSQCIYLDGDGDYLDLGTALNLFHSFTINVWVKSESETRSDAALLAKYETNAYGPYDFYLSNNRPAIWISTGGGGNYGYTEELADTTIDDKWHMITWTYKESERRYRIYIDGVEDKMIELDFDITINDDHVMIGRQAYMFEPYDHLEYRGYLDEFRVYDICLKPDEILNLYRYSPEV